MYFFTSFQDYFTYFEPIVSQRFAKTEEPGEKLPDLPLQNLRLTCDLSEARTHNDEGPNDKKACSYPLGQQAKSPGGLPGSKFLETSNTRGLIW